MSQLSAISPIDGRYHKQTAALGAYFSEYALIRYRVLVEVHYFLFLGDKKFFKVPVGLRKALLDVVEIFRRRMRQKSRRLKLLPTMM